MPNVFRRRGFDAHRQEEERRKQEAQKRRGNIWRFFLQDGDEDVPLRFLTEDPVLFYEHSLKLPGGKYDNEPCTGEDCPHCEAGDRPSYKGAWLVVDGREIEVDEKKDGKKTGKKKIIKDQIKLYVRGSTDIAKLDRLSRKFGLTTRPWFATKTGKNTSTSYELDRGEPSELTAKEIRNLLSKLPDKYKEHYDGTIDSLMDIVEDQIFGDVIEDSEEEESSAKRKPSKSRKYEEEDYEEDYEDEEDEDLEDGVQSLDEDEDEEEEEAPRKKVSKKLGTKKKKATTGKKVFKRR